MAGKRNGIQNARDRVTLAQLEDNVPAEVDELILDVSRLNLPAGKKSKTEIRGD